MKGSVGVCRREQEGVRKSENELAGSWNNDLEITNTVLALIPACCSWEVLKLQFSHCRFPSQVIKAHLLGHCDTNISKASPMRLANDFYNGISSRPLPPSLNAWHSGLHADNFFPRYRQRSRLPQSSLRLLDQGCVLGCYRCFGRFREQAREKAIS